MAALTSQASDFPRWYQDVVSKAELATTTNAERHAVDHTDEPAQLKQPDAEQATSVVVC
jgi:hypothetical protein